MEYNSVFNWFNNSQVALKHQRGLSININPGCGTTMASEVLFTVAD